MSDIGQPQNVVQFRPVNKRRATVSSARLPAAVHLLKEKATYMLQSASLGLFDAADDTLFELADKSESNQDQTLYFESMRQVRLCRREIEAKMIELVHESFDRLADPSAEVDALDYEIDVDNLSLVNNEQLELNVAVEAMVNKANERAPESLQHLTLRLDSLVPAKVYQRNMPVGPHEICSAFLRACDRLDTNIKVRLVLLKLFDRHVVSDLPSFYELANELMIQRNILPSLTSARQPRQTRAPRPVPGGRSIQTPSAPGGQSNSPEVLATFRNLVAGAPEAGSSLPVGFGAGSITSGGADNPVINENALLQALSQIQVQQTQSASANVGIDINQLQALLAQSQQGTIGQVDRDVINLINLLFEFIVEDRNLAAEMKAVLSRLQIPLLKVAIADKSFFDHGGHPAKRLLNEMATAALGWVPNQKGRDNLLGKIEQTVKRICDDSTVDHEVFDEMLMDFLTFTEKEKKQAAILEKRTLDAEAGKAKAESARADVADVLARIKDVNALSAPMQTLVHDAWANVMFLVALKDGIDSPQWNSAHSTVRNLVWSLTTEVTSENRVRLVKLLPELLKRLRAGLESISFNAYDMGKLFKQLEAEHLAQLRGQPAPAKVSEPAPEAVPEAVDAPASEDVDSVISVPDEQSVAAEDEQPAVSSAEPSVVIVDDAPPVPQVAEPAAGPEPQFLEQVDSLSQGSWFELRQPNEAAVRCRLAAIIRPTGKYIFVNRSGMKVAEKGRDELALNLRSGQIRMLDNSMLFDRALESVISNLRQSRNPKG